MQQCPKCEFQDISVTFYDKGVKVPTATYERIDYMPRVIRDVINGIGTVRRECMVYTCNTCRYKRAADPKDSNYGSPLP